MTPAIPKPSHRASSVERFGPGPLAWLGLSMAIACAGILAYAIYSPAFALSIAGTRPGSAPVLLMGLGALSLLVTAIALPLLLSEIRTDPDFLSWRTWRGMSRVPWHDVPDYYETSPSGRIQFYVIKTPHGDCRFSSENSKSDLLRARVVERAITARVKVWEPSGARAELDDRPITFAYDDPLNRWGFAVIRVIRYATIIAEVVYREPDSRAKSHPSWDGHGASGY